MDFERTYGEYFKPVYRFLLSLCRDPALAEELTQETFWRAMKTQAQYSGRCAPDTWLKSIAKNLYFGECRRLKRLTVLPEDAAEKAGPEDALENGEALEGLYETLHGLDEPYKEVFTLRVFGELSYAQIGKLFGKGESWCRVVFYRAKGMIREKIGRTEE